MKHANGRTAVTNGARASATPPAAVDGTDGGRLITRAQAAKILGWGYNTVKRREGIDLHPVGDAQGVYWFREEQVRALARRLQPSELIDDPAKHYDGATAAACSGCSTRAGRSATSSSPSSAIRRSRERSPANGRTFAAR